MSVFLQLLINGMVNGMMFAVLAVAFGLVYRGTHIFHIAFGAMFVLSAYAFFVGTQKFGLPIAAGILVAVLFSALLGCAIEAGIYRWFHRKASGNGAVLVASLGVFIVIENLVAMGFGNETLTFKRSVNPTIFTLGPIRLTLVQTAQFSLCLGALALSGIALRRFRVMKAIWAMGDDPELLRVLGNPLYRYRIIVFVLSAVLSSLPACLIALDTGINPQMGMHYLLIAAIATLAGGTERFSGWVIGGFLLSLVHSLVVWKLSSKWMDLATFVLLMSCLLFRPQGVAGIRRRLEEVG